MTFRNGRDLLAIFPGADPSCVVIDYKMPNMNGLEVSLRLRQLEIDVPVILVTGHPDPLIRRRAREAGVQVIEKPLSQDALLAAINAARAMKIVVLKIRKSAAFPKCGLRCYPCSPRRDYSSVSNKL